MMKWRVNRRNNSVDAEEVKSSLDMLDSVLAEYDDEDDELASCFPEWSYVQTDEIRSTDILLCSTPNGKSDVSDRVSSRRASGNGCQLRRPPPVVPKRDPSTRLSAHLTESFPPPSSNLKGSRPSSLPVNNTLSTFGGGLSSFVPPSHPPDVVPITLSRSKTLPSDFRQSLHFDVYLSSELPPKKPEQKRHSLKKRLSRKLW